jgi:hypothetical protein
MLASPGQRHDFQLIAVLQPSRGLLALGDQFTIQLDGDRFAVQFQLVQQIGNGQGRRVLLWLIVYDNIHGEALGMGVRTWGQSTEGILP